ncbi:MAG: hypothetical protein ACFE0O_15840 [Opitutales bacterium]
MMPLALITVLTALPFLALGLFFLLAGSRGEYWAKAFPRNRTATWILMGLAAGWFLWQVAFLSDADFGQYSEWLFAGFLTVAVLSFIYVPDFLAVRGLAALILLAAQIPLDAAWMRYELPGRLVMVTVVYLCILLALYLGAVPYRLRDFLAWLYARPGRVRGAGLVITGVGAAVGLSPLTYLLS